MYVIDKTANLAIHVLLCVVCNLMSAYIIGHKTPSNCEIHQHNQWGRTVRGICVHRHQPTANNEEGV